MTDLLLDSNALSSWADKDQRVLALLEAVRRVGGVVYVPTVCLIESLTGSHTNAALNQRLRGAVIVNLDEKTARLAAHLRADVDGDDAADPVVVATACLVRATIISVDDNIGDEVTGAPAHLRYGL